MSLERGVQIDVGDDLSVDDDKRLLFEELACVVECAAGPEDHWFFNIIEFDSEATAIPQRAPDRLGTVMQVHHDLVNTITGKIFGDVANERFSENRYRGFSAVFGEWPESCAVTGGKNDRAH